ncbi:hypothetical protein B0O80DRAFT_465472 [Mortierella sp. GBAus27b]|nr:hypothetical protein B0O80DRAFT_465472 [Mortierella sp. GBAus27b]
MTLPASFNTLPAEVVFYILTRLPPYDVLTLTEVSWNLRYLTLEHLSRSYGIQLSGMARRYPATGNDNRPMSDFELYIRLVLSDFYHQEQGSSGRMDAREYGKTVEGALNCSRKILQQLYLQERNSPSAENTHSIVRVIVDHVSRDKCLPEVAVLILQCLTSLYKQDRLRFLMKNSQQDASTAKLPTVEDPMSFGVLGFRYLTPIVLGILRTSTGIPPSTWTGLQLSPRDHADQTMAALLLYHKQLQLPQDGKTIPSVHIRSIPQLTRVLCFLPLLGRHFNTLSTEMFMETFLDRTGGDLLIDRATVLVYGFICVLDLERGKGSMESGSHIFQRSMPTQGAVQVGEIVRIIERHQQLLQTLSHSQHSQHSQCGFDLK